MKPRTAVPTSLASVADSMSPATIEETRQIVANVRERVPNATICITGQPLYDDPNSCFLAGNGGPDKTDHRSAVE